MSDPYPWPAGSTTATPSATMSDSPSAATGPDAHDTTAIPRAYPLGEYPPAAVPPADAGAYWHGRFRRERTKSRVLIGVSLALTLLTMALGVATWQLLQPNSVVSQISAAAGLSDLLDGQPAATPSAEPTAPAATPGASAGGDLAELQQLAQGLRNEDGSINALGVAALAGKLSSLAKDPQRLNSLLDEAVAAGIIDSQVAGMLHGLLATSSSGN